ncbi:hybrid sensor histidine kinase/response regulator (plasmid) [Azospirillum baldaniorum]|uniref:histidine kinase n=2 Tax=Azospirillum baldaniorum TaxID=1064539 RepID=A0A9P1NNM1_9PROT|nr:ATP-binding protein [Azospirillum baldaniorum]AWJ91669.1 hybrid sensor histidine kinase/response regulator [Azospirillum baldaniorum]TWA83464.1 signal transduction histidine kinase [Azospirillum brasilense]CCD00008.1 putative two-component hybrid sensor and regulator [Azospirillum baldaniorum]
MQRAHLVAAFLTFAALCVGVSALSVSRDRHVTLEQARREFAATAHLLDEHASRAIEAGDAQLRMLLDALERWDRRDPAEGRRIQAAMHARAERLPQVGGVWALDARGRLLLDSAEHPPPPRDLSERDYAQAHLGVNQGPPLGLHVGSHLPAGPGISQGRFTISRALRDEEGILQAIAVAGIRNTYFSQMYGEAGWGEGARLALFTSAKEKLAEWPPNSAVEPPTTAWPQPWDPPDGPAIIEGTQITAARMLTGFPIVVVASRPLAEVLAPWRERALWTTAVSGGILTGALVLFVFALAGARREDAVRAELLRANQSLDERVRQRTADLEKALRSAEMASLAKMKVLATVSHDLRQPLQGLAAFHELLLKEAPNPTLQQLGAMASASLQAGQRLLDDLLTLSRLEAGVVPVEISAFPLAPLLDQLAAELRTEAESKGLRLTVMPTKAWVRSDPARLQPILRNLLSNAVKYTARGGVIVGARPRGDGLRVEIWDSGQGIAAAELGTIWEEFYQIGNPARDGSRGAGLGLSIVERTARLLGHPLEVRSRVGRGSVFTVTLPRVPPPAAPAPMAVPRSADPAPPARTAESSPGRLAGRRVLVVEDDPLQRSSLTLLLEQAGAGVMAAESFDSALAAAQATLQAPSVILSDYRLPGGTDGLSGIQTLRGVLGREVPAILLTGELSADLVRAAKDAGCLVLTKPAAPNRILSTLAELTAGADAAA